MTQTVTVNERSVQGNMKVRIATVDITSYVNNGEAILPAALGMNSFKMVTPITSENGYVFKWDYTNNKLVAYYGNYSSSTDGALVQVAAGVDVGTVRVKFEGK